MNELMNGQRDEWMDGQTDVHCMYGQMDRWMNEWNKHMLDINNNTYIHTIQIPRTSSPLNWYRRHLVLGTLASRGSEYLISTF